ncbi:hypothetical protein SORBI_3010G023066 [Sorghum bicolor]|uniref:Uncharacterized protein n=1 Tax=Sorghum bicolor TaxID=4558 RepID=A0A1W0VR74_SORBI|nr:hypothetical protein SORBI_3010G023066 [Sorghum bicolor]
MNNNMSRTVTSRRASRGTGFRVRDTDTRFPRLHLHHARVPLGLRLRPRHARLPGVRADPYKTLHRGNTKAPKHYVDTHRPSSPQPTRPIRAATSRSTAMDRLVTSMVFCEAPVDFAYGGEQRREARSGRPGRRRRVVEAGSRGSRSAPRLHELVAGAAGRVRAGVGRAQLPRDRRHAQPLIEVQPS